MRELLTVQDGGGKSENGASNVSTEENGSHPDGAPLVEEEVESIRLRTAAFLLGAGRCFYAILRVCDLVVRSIFYSKSSAGRVLVGGGIPYLSACAVCL